MQYRYADKKYTTSSSYSLSGWTRYKTGTVYGSWGGWSGWRGTAQTGSDTKQVQTRKEYRYYYFYCPKCGGHEPFQGTSDCHQYSLSLANAVEGWFPIAYSNCNSHAYSYTTEKRWTESLGDGQRWNFSSGNINDTAVGTHDYGYTTGSVIRIGYRYRTRSKSTKYYYYKWGAWSSWSTTKYTASGNRKVETRTVTVRA